MVFDDLRGDDVRIGEVGAVFEAFVFEPEPSRWEAARQTGRSRDRLSGSEGVNMSRFRWKARPRVSLRYGSRLSRSSYAKLLKRSDSFSLVSVLRIIRCDEVVEVAAL